MIGQVHEGEKITATGYNQLVDFCNRQPDQVSQQDEKFAYREGGFISLFQVKQGKGYKMESRPRTYQTESPEIVDTTWIMLGSGVDCLKQNITLDGKPVEQVILINNGNQGLNCELEQGCYGDQGQFYDGWVDLQLSAQSIYGKIYKEEISGESEEEISAAKTAFVISDISGYGDLEQVKQLMDTDNDISSVLEIVIASRTTPGTLPGESGSSIQFSQLAQMHTGAIVAGGQSIGGAGGEEYFGDSQISKLNMKSIQIISASVEISTEVSGEISSKTINVDNIVQLYGFQNEHLDPAVWEPTGDLSCADVVLRTMEVSGSTRKYGIEYFPISSLVTVTDDQALEDEGEEEESPIQHRSRSIKKDLERDFIRINGYSSDDDCHDVVTYDEIQEKVDKYDVLMRFNNDDASDQEYDNRFINVAELLSASVSAVLSSLSSELSGLSASVLTDTQALVELETVDNPSKSLTKDPSQGFIRINGYSSEDDPFTPVSYDDISADVDKYDVLMRFRNDSDVSIYENRFINISEIISGQSSEVYGDVNKYGAYLYGTRTQSIYSDPDISGSLRLWGFSESDQYYETITRDEFIENGEKVFAGAAVLIRDSSFQEQPEEGEITKTLRYVELASLWTIPDSDIANEVYSSNTHAGSLEFSIQQKEAGGAYEILQIKDFPLVAKVVTGEQWAGYKGEFDVMVRDKRPTGVTQDTHSPKVSYIPLGELISAQTPVSAYSSYGCYWVDNAGTFRNCYYSQGGVPYAGPGGGIGSYQGQIVALKTDSYGNTTLRGYSTLEALRSDAAGSDCAVAPLYKVDVSGNIECDFRMMPRLETWGTYS